MPLVKSVLHVNSSSGQKVDIHPQTEVAQIVDFQAGLSTNLPSNIITEGSNISLLNNDAGYVTANVKGLTNYYNKDNTYNKTEIDNKITSIPKFNIEVVRDLPTKDISTSTVYLKVTGTETQNIYTEYIFVNNNWEKLGTQTLDLSGYALKTEIPTKLSQLTNNINAVTAVTTGTNNGEIKVTSGSTTTNVKVKGLDSAAYKPTTAFVGTTGNQTMSGSLTLPKIILSSGIEIY
jgi:hypothetical protein